MVIDTLGSLMMGYFNVHVTMLQANLDHPSDGSNTPVHAYQIKL